MPVARPLIALATLLLAGTVGVPAGAGRGPGPAPAGTESGHLAASAAPPAEPGVDGVVDRLQDTCNRVRTLEASFVQILRSVAFGEPQEERGRLFLLRPGRMRWEYEHPEKKLAVVDGQRSFLYVPAENQVFVGDLDQVRRGGAAGLLLDGNLDLRRDFLLQPGPETERRGEGSVSLLPRSPQPDYDRLDVTVDMKTGLPVRIVVHTPLDEEMEYRFSDLRQGRPLDPDLFRFQPPAGTEVVQAD
jgi:outer membrane lipoprotein carrier protein